MEMLLPVYGIDGVLVAAQSQKNLTDASLFVIPSKARNLSFFVVCGEKLTAGVMPACPFAEARSS